MPAVLSAYKMGEIKIRELRAMAEEERGEEFDLREFHDERVDRLSFLQMLLNAREIIESRIARGKK
jgi:uncharacterized protein (DUF885 family)